MIKKIHEWKILKTYAVPMIINPKSSGYLEIWKRIFTNHELKAEYMNVLLVFKYC